MFLFFLRAFGLGSFLPILFLLFALFGRVFLAFPFLVVGIGDRKGLFDGIFEGVFEGVGVFFGAESSGQSLMNRFLIRGVS